MSPSAAAGTEKRMMAVEVGGGDRIQIGRPRSLFDLPRDFAVCDPVRCYDVAPDGQSFYFRKAIPSAPPLPVTHISLIQNWVEELKAKVPSGR